MIFPLAGAYLKREGKNLSIRLLLGRGFGIFFTVSFWFFMSHFFRRRGGEISSAFLADYFTFVLIGLALSQYFSQGFSSFGARLKSLKDSGMLETLWVIPAPFLLLLVLFGLWDLVWATLNAGAILWLGAGVFGAKVSLAQGIWIMGLGLTVAVSAVCGALLVFSCSLAWDRGEALRQFLPGGMLFLSGVFFPMNLLPAFLKSLAMLLPLTHAVSLARGPAWTLEPLGKGHWLMLGGLLGMQIILSLWVWRGTIQLARRKGGMTPA